MIAQEIVQLLTKSSGGEDGDGPDIETEVPQEVQADLESVMKEHLRQERRVVDETKNRMEIRGLSYGELGRVKSQVARDLKISTGGDALPYLVEQMLEMLFHSANVEEVYAEDIALRKKITQVLRRHMDVEQELDREVRGKIRNLEEGTASFETEYARVMESLKRNRRLT